MNTSEVLEKQRIITFILYQFSDSIINKMYD
jgi:hypothetical protein